MSFFQRSRKILAALALVFMLTITTACSSAVAREPQTTAPIASRDYGSIARGNTTAGQDYGTWAVQASKGLLNDAYVRDNNKLGVVISPQVRPSDVKPLTQSLMQGFHKSFPNQDLSVLVYAPDKKLILTARYDIQSNQVNYQQPS
ncbi:hypothetical protein [Myxacorys almedinensis]|uniref:Lipoprotein n=1 Tax=Myxacorys almedinensis A TaxID=2690445 RepID=A0A8J8CMM2_9CYAN|nr:hypothetical protein [Myxacorys almedinensis]NDJ18830.1 hypothetical protein [Myxacorys almedinensis A]